MVEEEGTEHAILTVGKRRLAVSPHAALRMELRGITANEIAEAIATGNAFRYFHEGSWKEGYYKRDVRLFVGVVDETVSTVIRGVSDNYIANLRAGAP